MPITILSPYSGRPVKVRDQDLERALRDEEGRIFYVVEGTDGKGYYASMTRKGSEKDQQRYRKLDERGAVVDQKAKQNVLEAHDATGRKRRNPVGTLVLLLIIAALAGAGYVYVAHPQWLGLGDEPAVNEPSDPSPPATPEPDPDNPTDQRSEQTEWTPATPISQLAPYRIISISSELAPEPEESQRAAEQPAAPIVDTEPQTNEPPAPQPEPTDTTNPAAEPETQGEPEPDAEPEAAAEPEAPRRPRTWRPETAAGEGEAAGQNQDPFANFHTTASGLRYKTTQLTDGSPAMLGCFLQVRFAAYQLDGTPIIDDAQQQFVIMTGRAIRAFDEGLAGMREGEQRLILVPKGHSTTGELAGVEELPDGPFVLDVQLVAVRPGITHIIETPGHGDPARPGDTVTLHYRAWVEGKDESFDSSQLRGQPMTLTLGQGEVIPGLELGVAGIQPGETRLLTIPPYLAYGDREIAGGLIPANAVLTYRLTAEKIETARSTATAN